ncbi:hypothetical protein L6Q96_06795 [Candidatus Binatia bacterium]|nr:hypothetical protein [Candidatus Binatia bacterium]
MARYDALARLFTHPGPGLHEDLRAAIELHERDYPEAVTALRRFADVAPLNDLLAMQELHLRTFDVQPIACLDVGYTLFGEDYKRGALLANLSREHIEVGNDCGLELADHLPNVLRLLAKWQNHAVREEFVRVMLGPAVQEMVREFEPDRIEKKENLYKRHHKTVIESAAGDRRFAYRHLLAALESILAKDFGPFAGLPTQRESKFAGSVGTEMGIESCGSGAADQ